MPIDDAFRKNKLVGLPSYHMIDNPEYRDALPFGDRDMELIRKHGLATMAKIRTIGKATTPSPPKTKRIPLTYANI